MKLLPTRPAGLKSLTQPGELAHIGLPAEKKNSVAHLGLRGLGFRVSGLGAWGYASWLGHMLLLDDWCLHHLHPKLAFRV